MKQLFINELQGHFNLRQPKQDLSQRRCCCYGFSEKNGNQKPYGCKKTVTTKINTEVSQVNIYQLACL